MYDDMTQYYSTSDSSTVGTIGNYYHDYMYRNSTTSYSNRTNYATYYNDKTNWDYYSTTTTTSSSIYIPNIGAYIKPQVIREVKPSKEELLRREEERLKAVEEAKKAKEEAEEAAKKARVLLTEYLDDENLQRLLNKQPLEVSSGLFSDVKYHIPISNGRIKALKDNKVITELCLSVQDSRNLPTDDIVLAKMLHVLHDEENMLRTANHFNNKEENLLARLN